MFVRLFTAFLSTLLLGGCSEALKIDFINETEKRFTICSSREDAPECIPVPVGSVSRVQWGNGEFRLTTTFDSWAYSLSVPEPFSEYVAGSEGVVTIVVKPNMQFYILRPEEGAMDVDSSTQPAGWPEKPHA